MKHQRTNRWADPVELMAAGAGLSGLEQMCAVAEGRIPPPPVGSLIGIMTAEAKLVDKSDRLFANATSTPMILRGPAGG